MAGALGVANSIAARLVREVAREDEANAPKPPIAGCWVSPGWSEGLTAPADWPDLPTSDGTHGLATVLVARAHGYHSVSVSGFLVDVYCLGVKGAFGPKVKRAADLPAIVRAWFGAYDGPPLPVTIEVARELVWGGVAYARSLGFNPHPDFELAATHLGSGGSTGAITFGCHGKPYFVEGPPRQRPPHPPDARTLRRRGQFPLPGVSPVADRSSGAHPLSGRHRLSNSI